MRIAMWSGPRNISTALMRAWENRDDTVVVDEPLYAHYLATTGRDHPGRDEVIASQSTDWRVVTDQLREPLPPGITISYAKHMAHHLLPSVGREWLGGFSHAFLIRDPREMLPSLARVLPTPTLADTGLEQQVEIVQSCEAEGAGAPPVIDARDVLRAPAAMLQALCEQLGVAFSPAMLSWPAGSRGSDGVWARWWYDAVIASTGFEQYRPPAQPFPPPLRPLLEQCLPYYQRLAAKRITV
jgi:hypothetical protein